VGEGGSDLQDCLAQRRGLAVATHPAPLDYPLARLGPPIGRSGVVRFSSNAAVGPRFFAMLFVRPIFPVSTAGGLADVRAGAAAGRLCFRFPGGANF